MIKTIHMPYDSRRFPPVIESIELRRSSYQNEAFWIGQSENQIGDLEECDRNECYHIVNWNGLRAIGYARLKPVTEDGSVDAASQQIFQAAIQSTRMPAFELQRVSLRDSSENDVDGYDQIGVLRELVMEALRIVNFNQCKFIYTSCDKGGTAALRKTGVRYSTLSTPFSVDGRDTVVLCIPVTNKNMLALNPFKLVGGTRATNTSSMRNVDQPPTMETPSIFDKMDGLAAIRKTEDLERSDSEA